MKTLTLKLPPSLDRALAARAKRQNRTKSAVVRQALEELLSGPGKKGKATFFELAGHLSGKFSGPSDLSTNEKYMKDFGL